MMDQRHLANRNQIQEQVVMVVTVVVILMVIRINVVLMRTLDIPA
jgi:hypothetical protein